MKINKKTLVYLVIMLVGYISVCFTTLQKEENPFLGKAYWTEQPSIASIEENIKKGFSITKSNKHGFDPICYAILEKNPVSTIDYLLSKGNDVNKMTHDSRTYIFWAAYKDNLDLMKHLLAKGAKTDLIDSHGYSLMNFAAATGLTNTDIYEFCITNGADIKNEKTHEGKNALLAIAPKLKDLTMVDYFISKGLKITDVDNHGNGIFNHAAKGGNITVLKALEKRGVSTKVNPKTNENAFSFATKGGRGITINEEVFTYLESLGLNPNVKSDKGVTPLHNLARSSETISNFDYFINKGVNVNTVDENGDTALLKASGRNDLEIVTYLAEKSNDVNTINKKGHSALTNAIRSNTDEVVSYLLSKGAKVTILDAEKNTLTLALIDSYTLKDAEVFDAKKEALVNAGLDLKKPQGNGSSLYHLAIAKNDVALLKKIDALGLVDINAKDNKGNTVLHYAAMKSDNTKALDFLISKGANKSIKTTFGESVYDLAKENELLQETSISFLK